MKKVITSIFILFSNIANSQISRGSAISNDGQYVFSCYINYDNHKTDRSLVIQKTFSSRKIVIKGATDILFANDNKGIFYKIGDTLFLRDLISNTESFFLHVKSYKNSADGNWLAFQASNFKNTISLINLSTGKQLQYQNVANYFFCDAGNDLILLCGNEKNNSSNQIRWVDVRKLQTNIIWSESGKKVMTWICDNSGTRIAFITADDNENSNAILLYY